MPRFTEQVHIDAPKDQVWATLADIGSIYKWNPGVTKSYSTSDATQGEGATRHCDLEGGSNYLDERAFDWKEGEGFKIDIYDTNMPLKRNVVHFTVEADGDGTLVSVSPDYELKFGPIGVLMDKLFAGRQFRNGMAEMLAGLKHHVETGELVGDEVATG